MKAFLACVIILGLLTIIVGQYVTAPPNSGHMGGSAPDKPLDLKVTAVDGREIDFAKLRGKVVLLDFWATWCPPCRDEVPHVVDAYKKFHDQGFEIVGVSLDQDMGSLLTFTQQNGMTWPQFFDGNGWNNQVSAGFGIEAIPAMWLIGRDGKVITTNAREDLAGQIAKALAAK